jgi:AcrR family transcriptional regulator
MTGNQGKPTARGAQRRRGKVLEDALLTAAWDEVTAVGYAKFTMEGAAARAGTARSILYRRWPTRAALVHAAVRHHVIPLDDQVPDTGDLRQDLLSVLRHQRDNFRQIKPEVAHGLMTEASDIPADVFQVTPRAITAILTRAAERGQVRPDRITPPIARLPGDLVRHEILLQHGDAPDTFLAQILDEVFLPLVTAAPSQQEPQPTTTGPASAQARLTHHEPARAEAAADLLTSLEQTGQTPFRQ